MFDRYKGNYRTNGSNVLEVDNLADGTAKRRDSLNCAAA